MILRACRAAVAVLIGVGLAACISATATAAESSTAASSGSDLTRVHASNWGGSSARTHVLRTGAGCSSDNPPPDYYQFLHRYEDLDLVTACELCAFDATALQHNSPMLSLYCWEFKPGVAYLYYHSGPDPV